MRKLLFALVLLAGCKSSTVPGTVPIEPALLSLVPGDTVGMAGVRFDVLKKTSTWQKHFSARKMPELDDLTAKTGINLREDLWQILAVSDGKRSAILARGKFSETGMEPRINIEGAKRIPYKGQTLIGTEEACVTFVNPTTAIFGKTGDVRYILDQRDKASVPPQLKAVLATVPPASQFWVAALGGQNTAALGLPQEGNLANLNRIYGSLQQVMLSVDMSSGVKVLGRGTANSDEDARRLTTALKGLIGLGRLCTPDNQPEMLRVWDAMQVEQKDRAVSFDANFPDEMVDKLAGMLPERPK